MTDAAHNQHSETRRPSDRDRIITTGSSRFRPTRPEVLCRLRGSPKNRCLTTVAEPIGGKRERNCPLPGTKSVCLGHNQAARTTIAERGGLKELANVNYLTEAEWGQRPRRSP